MKEEARRHKKGKLKTFRIFPVRGGLSLSDKDTLKRQAEFFKESLYFFARD